MSLTRKSQSALEYLMTYGWAILIIVIVAGVLYSFGVFNPSSSTSTSVSGFSSLGVTQAACVNSVNNQILELYVSNSVGYPVNVTKINVTGNNGITVSQNVSSILSAGQSGIFYVNGACNKSSSSYSGSATITYTEPGQTFFGPYFSAGKIFNVQAKNNRNLVGNFSSAYINGSFNGGFSVNTPISITLVGWVNDPTGNNIAEVAVGSETYGCSTHLYEAGLNSYGSNTLTYHGCCYDSSSSAINNFNRGDGKWHFIAIIYSYPAQTITFINNNTVQTDSWPSSAPSLGGRSFLIGQDMCDHWDTYGYEANLQVYNTALSISQIQNLYSEGRGGAPIPNAGLVGWWPLDGNANDYSGNGDIGVNSGVAFVSH